MAPSTLQQLDRHALVMTVWLAAGLVAATLLHYGLGRASAAFTLGGFGVILAGFIGHVIVNRLHATTFSDRELGVGLVLYAAALVGFGLATLFRASFATGGFAAISAGFILIAAVVVFAMLAQSGVRGAFASFDVIRTFRPAPPARHGGDTG